MPVRAQTSSYCPPIPTAATDLSPEVLQRHGLGDKGSDIGPSLGSRQASLTIAQFSGQMWNHSPEIWRQMKARGIARPAFSGSEMADLIAFLYNFNYFVNAGSSKAGEARFAERGCATCHGALGQGTDIASAAR